MSEDELEAEIDPHFLDLAEDAFKSRQYRMCKTVAKATFALAEKDLEHL